MVAWTLLTVFIALFFETQDASAHGFRGGTRGASRSSSAQISFRASHGFSHARIGVPQAQVRRSVPPSRGFTRVVPGPVFVTPVAPAFHHFSRPLVHPVFPRHRGVLIIGVPGVIGTTAITRAAPGVAYLDPATASAFPRVIHGRAADPLAPFDPTPQEVVERLLALAAVRQGDLLYDLGSGDGRILIAAAKIYGVKSVGFEIDPGLVKLARENVRQEKMEELVEIRQQDFMTADLSPASVVTLYLSNDGNLAVRPKLMRELKPGARVVSYTFDMGDWPSKIAETYRDAAGHSHLLYLWQMSEPIASSEISSPIQ
jgi:hypothetical protein